MYRSTRASHDQQASFEDAVMKGLASDGGLFVPSQIPKLPASFTDEWAQLSFQELAFNIMRFYIDSHEISDSELRGLITNSYSTFRDLEITPLRNLDPNHNLHLLELFHGPTYAFKDVALQFVGNLFEFFLTRRNAAAAPGQRRQTLTVVGATSGDTGSAAIYGLRGKKDVDVFILYPTGRISPIQEQQMTTVEDANVHTLSVKGTFDDCQDIVKQIFGDAEFNRSYHVGAVNSINWARILAQMTYYFYAYFRIRENNSSPINFVVPSGNFGDILAGYYAKEMGLPINKLIIATNENDILDRFLKTGHYQKSNDVKPTHSPAMDILISSNFERLLWYLVRNNVTHDDNKAGDILLSWMNQLKTTGSVIAPKEVIDAARRDFDSEAVSDKDTTSTIKQVYATHPDNYVLDPHSAVGVNAAYRFIAKDPNSVYISLATAHPAKFADVVNEALTEIQTYSFERDVLPEQLKELASKPKRINLIDEATVQKVKSKIVDLLSS